MTHFLTKLLFLLSFTFIQAETCIRPIQGDTEDIDSETCDKSITILETCLDKRVIQGCYDCDSCTETLGETTDAWVLPARENCTIQTHYLKQGDNTCTRHPPTIITDILSINGNNHLAIYVDPDFDQTAELSYGEMKELSNYFYDYFNDAYDFIFIVSNNLEIPVSVGYYGRFYPAGNSIEGIGKSIYDSTTYFGSAGQLQGMMHFPYRRGIDSGPTLHELSHNWANSLINTGSPSHWNYTGFYAMTSSGAKGQLGGYDASTLIDEGDGIYSAGSFGTFANGGNSLPYNDIELYLMGLIDKSNVGDVQIADNPVYDSYLNYRKYFSADSIQRWSFSDLLDELGVGDRNPSSATSQKSFRILTVLAGDQEPTQEEIDEAYNSIKVFSYDNNDTSYIYNFYEATGGRASLKVDDLVTTLK